MQNLNRKWKGARGRDLKALSKCSTTTYFVIIFNIYYALLKIVTNVMSTLICITSKNLIKIEHIKAHLSSFKLFSSHLGLFRLIYAHLS